MFPFSDYIITPFDFDRLAFKLSVKFFANAILIGIIELSNGIKSPKIIASIVAKAVGKILNRIPGEFLNKYPYR